MFGIKELSYEIGFLKVIIENLSRKLEDYIDNEITLSDVKTQIQYQINEFLEELDRKLLQKEFSEPVNKIVPPKKNGKKK